MCDACVTTTALYIYLFIKMIGQWDREQVNPLFNATYAVPFPVPSPFLDGTGGTAAAPIGRPGAELARTVGQAGAVAAPIGAWPSSLPGEGFAPRVRSDATAWP